MRDIKGGIAMKRIISIILAIMIMSPIANAATWITVSSWAYNDVSNFKKEGMLPESLEEVGDFTQPVTRLQFAQILYSALMNVADDSTTVSYSSIGFCDTDDKAAEFLFWCDIVNGEKEPVPEDEARYEGELRYYFRPDRLLTREEMAVMIGNTVNWYFSDDFSKGNYSAPADYTEISDWARESVVKMMGIGLISGVGENKFGPKTNLTIEQAISVVYRFYSYLPTANTADGANITGNEETEVQTYKNGIVETKKGNMLYLKQDGNVLMEFETDIYANIYCETVDGKVYAAAQNCYGKTDIYDVTQKQITAKIPYPVYAVDSEYIIAKSSVIGPFGFGLYKWDGTAVTEVKYSLEELDEFKNTGSVSTEYQSPNGMIYFSDWNNNGCLSVMDSNGENKRKLSDKNCTSRIKYVDGRLYFIAEENGKYSLCSVKTDGTGEVTINEYTEKMGSASDMALVRDRYEECYDIGNDSWHNGMGKKDVSNRDDSVNGRYESVARDGEWIYYICDNNEYYNTGEFNAIGRFRITDDNKVEKENVTGDIIANGFSAQVKDGKLYFIDEKKHYEKSKSGKGAGSDLYCYDGEKLTKLNGDLTVIDYYFYEDKIVMEIGVNYEDTTMYIAEADGSNAQVFQEAEEAKKRYQEREEGRKGMYDTYDPNDESTWIKDLQEMVHDNISDEKYTVYDVYNRSVGSYPEEGMYVRDSEGNERKLPDNIKSIYKRYGDTLIVAEGLEAGKGTRKLLAYDMETGQTSVAAENMYKIVTISSGDYSSFKDTYITYYDKNMNIWVYDILAKETREVHPNSGSKKFGKVVDIIGNSSGMYKFDTEGNYSLVTNSEYAANCLYVENGTGKCITF